MTIFAGRQSKADAEHLRDLEAKVAAVDRVQVVAEFQMDGQIIRTNANFLALLGYSATEVAGRNHRMFVDPQEAASDAYRDFWRQLARGETVAAKFHRLGRGGKECWVRGTYNPILDALGKPYKVIHFSLDVTLHDIERKRVEAEREEVAKEQALLINDLASNLSRLSQGDLTALMTSNLKGQYGLIKDDFNRAIPALREAMSGIAQATAGLRGGSAEIARAADDLSRRRAEAAALVCSTMAAFCWVT